MFRRMLLESKCDLNSTKIISSLTKHALRSNQTEVIIGLEAFQNKQKLILLVDSLVKHGIQIPTPLLVKIFESNQDLQLVQQILGCWQMVVGEQQLQQIETQLHLKRAITPTVVNFCKQYTSYSTQSLNSLIQQDNQQQQQPLDHIIKVYHAL